MLNQFIPFLLISGPVLLLKKLLMACQFYCIYFFGDILFETKWSNVKYPVN